MYELLRQDKDDKTQNRLTQGIDIYEPGCKQLLLRGVTYILFL